MANCVWFPEQECKLKRRDKVVEVKVSKDKAGKTEAADAAVNRVWSSEF